MEHTIEKIDWILFSISGLPVTAAAPCPTKALLAKTSRDTPVSIWPAFVAFKPSTGIFVPV